MSDFQDNLDQLSETLEEMSDSSVMRKHRKQVQPLRGIRGVSFGEVAALGAATWEEQAPKLPADGPSLTALFGTAWEDGLIAIGLLATCVPDQPKIALNIGLEWATRVDDTQTADALGWLVLGPASLASQQGMLRSLSEIPGHGRPAVRRMLTSAALACTTAAIEGPSAAPLRARLQAPQVRYVDEALIGTLRDVVDATWRDEAPQVRKGVRRLIRAWGQDDDLSLKDWSEHVRGGLPTMLRAEIKKAHRKGEKRRAREAQA